MALKSMQVKGKLRWSLLPLELLTGVVRVLMRGADKYSDFDWMDDVKHHPQVYHDALMRHIERHFAGELRDGDDNELHVDHAIANLIILKWYIESKLKEAQC